MLISIRTLLLKQLVIRNKLDQELSLSRPNHLKIARLKLLMLKIQYRLRAFPKLKPVEA